MNPSAALRSIDRLKKGRQKIQIAKKELQLDDAIYRAILLRTAGVSSSTEINTEAKIGAVMDEFGRLGFQHKPKIAAGRHKGAPASLERDPYLQKIEALLADMELPWAYAEKIAENITGGKKPESIKRLVWVKQQKHLVGIVAALHNEKKKRLGKALEALGIQLAARALTPEWARQSAEDMGRLAQPWRWYECLETLRLIAARLAKLG